MPQFIFYVNKIFTLAIFLHPKQSCGEFSFPLFCASLETVAWSIFHAHYLMLHLKQSRGVHFGGEKCVKWIVGDASNEYQKLT